jgi:hypothetical protein
LGACLALARDADAREVVFLGAALRAGAFLPEAVFFEADLLAAGFDAAVRVVRLGLEVVLLARLDRPLEVPADDFRDAAVLLVGREVVVFFAVDFAFDRDPEVELALEGAFAFEAALVLAAVDRVDFFAAVDLLAVLLVDFLGAALEDAALDREDVALLAAGFALEREDAAVAFPEELFRAVELDLLALDLAFERAGAFFAVDLPEADLLVDAFDREAAELLLAGFFAAGFLAAGFRAAELLLVAEADFLAADAGFLAGAGFAAAFFAADF